MIITMKQCHDLRSVLNIGCFGKFICRQTARTVNCAIIFFLRNGRLFEVIRSVENDCINTRTINGHINESGRLFSTSHFRLYKDCTTILTRVAVYFEERSIKLKRLYRLLKK